MSCPCCGGDWEFLLTPAKEALCRPCWIRFYGLDGEFPKVYQPMFQSQQEGLNPGISLNKEQK